MDDDAFDLTDTAPEKKVSSKRIAAEERKVERLAQEKHILDEDIAEQKKELEGIERDEERVAEQLEREERKLSTMESAGSFWASTKSWLWKNKALFLIIIPILLSIYVRVDVQDLPILDDYAASSVQNFIRGDISAVVSANYPNLPSERHDTLVNQQLSTALKAGTYTIQTGQYKGQAMNIANEVQSNAKQLRSFWQYDLHGKEVTYMPDIDPYFYLRYARNYLDHGYIGDTITPDGWELDTHARPPAGARISIQKIGFHPLVMAWIYQVHSVFDPNTDLMQSASLFPLIICALAIIPAFFLGRRLSGNVGGFFAATMAAVNVAAVGRTPIGHADTDAYNILFPLLAMWLVVEAFRAKALWKRITLMGLASLTLGLYTLAWSGWWYLFDFIVGAMAVQLAWDMGKHLWGNRSLAGLLKAIDVRHNKQFRDNIIAVGAFVITTGIFVTVFMNFDAFINSPLQPLRFTDIKDAAKPDLWPNVYTTVAELNPGSVGAAIDAVGGNLLFAIGILGIILLAVAAHENKRTHIFEAALLIFWFIGSIYATTQGIRFTLLLAQPFSIAFGCALGIVFMLALKHGSSSLRLPKPVIAIACVVIFGILLLGPIAAAKESVKRDLPLVNDAWFNSLDKIKRESQPDAIINSWWDFGHHFKYIADRRVTFDGGSQNNPPAHWIGLMLMTDNENLAMGILRMMDCGGRVGVDALRNTTANTGTAAALARSAITVEREEARDIYLDAGVPESDVERILSFTHCTPPENYFITSDDMIGKAGVWAHFGGWNFVRSHAIVFLRNADKDSAVTNLTKTFNISETDAENIWYDMQGITSEEQINSWVSPWPSYLGGETGCGVQDNVIVCGNGVIYNMSNGESRISVQGNTGIPRSISYIDANGKFAMHTYNDSTIDASAAIIPSGSGFTSIIMSPDLVASMFTRLYFFGGHGLEHFDLFTQERQLTGGKVAVWKVDWKGGAPREVYTVQKPEPVVEAKKETPLNVTGNATKPKTDKPKNTTSASESAVPAKNASSTTNAS